ncbi:hypothetical protein [Teredinibacter sp. KSP-S5-2]|uniref:hypothetical protein n=1 Tax=Teredinibacter sp. KSP-S5-2 TaxID=3034506 RepID=UPI00293482D5|nr:hypothetical protein [Teredinibacter sp. KSP-S5-2]WNO10824.1 hypothetical protein P5V12_06500 [Teredinibacter sp. KSP-S5-2]
MNHRDPIQLLSEMDLIERDETKPEGNNSNPAGSLTDIDGGVITPRSLIIDIFEKNLGTELIHLARVKGDKWILEMVRHLPVASEFSTECVVELVFIVSSPEAKTYLLQRISGWPWNQNARDKIPQLVLQYNYYLFELNNSDKDSFTRACDTEMYTAILEELENIHDTMP